MTLTLTMQERLKDLGVEHALMLEQLAEQTHLFKSTLGSYKADDSKDISTIPLSIWRNFTARPTTICWGCPK